MKTKLTVGVTFDVEVEVEGKPGDKEFAGRMILACHRQNAKTQLHRLIDEGYYHVEDYDVMAAMLRNY